MATLMSRGLTNFLRFNNVLRQNIVVCSRSLQTTKGKKDTITLRDLDTAPKTVEDFANVKKQKNWVSYGFSENSEAEDRRDMHTHFFIIVTVVICGACFYLTYIPDYQDRDWTVREAFLEIHRRKKLGLPLVDKNFIDPEKVVLPSEEELGFTEIII